MIRCSRSAWRSSLGRCWPGPSTRCRGSGSSAQVSKGKRAQGFSSLGSAAHLRAGPASGRATPARLPPRQPEVLTRSSAPTAACHLTACRGVGGMEAGGGDGRGLKRAPQWAERDYHLLLQPTSPSSKCMTGRNTLSYRRTPVLAL